MGKFFSDNPNNYASGPIKRVGYLSQLQTHEEVLNSGECFNPYSSILAMFNSGNVCSETDYLNGRFQSATADNTPFANYTAGNGFSIYAGPTGNNQNIMMDFYTMDKQNQEYISRGSPRMVVFKLDREATKVDTTLGEAETDEFYKKGVVVQGLYMYSPIQEQLLKFGIESSQDLQMKFNYSHLLERLGRPIMAGDMIVVYLTSYRLDPNLLAQDTKSKDYYVRQVQVIFRVNTAIPTNLFLYQYMMVECNCEKSNLDIEHFDISDIYELNEVPPDVNSDTSVNPVPIQY